jgi:hypothetical protein
LPSNSRKWSPNSQEVLTLFSLSYLRSMGIIDRQTGQPELVPKDP